MQFTEQGTYNLVVHELEPEELYEAFTNGLEADQQSRVENIEGAITYINDFITTDNFVEPIENDYNNQELLMKGYVLEYMRFQILRKSWEPMFNPFPHNPEEYHDPDVTVKQSRSGRGVMFAQIQLRKVPEEYNVVNELYNIHVHDRLDEPDSEYNYRINGLDTEVRLNDLDTTIQKFCTMIGDKYSSATYNEVASKLNKLQKRAETRIDEVAPSE